MLSTDRRESDVLLSYQRTIAQAQPRNAPKRKKSCDDIPDAVADVVRGLRQAAVIPRLQRLVARDLAITEEHRLVEFCPVTCTNTSSVL